MTAAFACRTSVLRDSNRVHSRVRGADGRMRFRIRVHSRCTAQVSVEMIEAILRLRKSEQVMVGWGECAAVGPLRFARSFR